MVEKDRANSDGVDMDGKTAVKGDVLTDTLDISNLYANLNVGDTITIIDPLEAGEYYNVDDNIAAAVANGWEVSYDAATETFTYKTTYTGEKLVVPTVDWAPAYDATYYDNTYKVLVNDNLYQVYSNTVKHQRQKRLNQRRKSQILMVTTLMGQQLSIKTLFSTSILITHLIQM